MKRLTTPPTQKRSEGLKRRQFIQTSLTASAGLAGILMSQTPPAMAQDRELRLLT